MLRVDYMLNVTAPTSAAIFASIALIARGASSLGFVARHAASVGIVRRWTVNLGSANPNS